MGLALIVVLVVAKFTSQPFPDLHRPELPWSSAATAPTASETLSGQQLRIVDGDTVALGSERIRILGIDAPESHEPRCQSELAAGLRAKERLGQVIGAAQVHVVREGQDVYKRTLARLTINGADVGQILLSEGLVLPGNGSTEARNARLKHWCS